MAGTDIFEQLADTSAKLVTKAKAIDSRLKRIEQHQAKTETQLAELQRQYLWNCPACWETL